MKWGLGTTASPAGFAKGHGISKKEGPEPNASLRFPSIHP